MIEEGGVTGAWRCASREVKCDKYVDTRLQVVEYQIKEFELYFVCSRRHFHY